MTETSTDDGKTVAIISYITLIGWIIALIMHNGNKTEFGAFHLRQSLGIIVVAIALAIINSFIGIAILGWIIQIGILVFWILGFIGAIQGEKKLVPLLGAQFQDWFKGIG
ncbi:DUF4870 domain-containing protein [Ulvibacter antarcticus]|uniref:Chloroplast import component protein (Tic20) n=1 Tax=Ulvibacter antarcticus TaxID=442714 RepID=A0A3L9YW22_9FLAO|nr:hypothetical protein [Ulvibacter antarcticus]RMA64514.1 hypothetical protein BXY75_1390 [Ulvibacter antarcticus]